MGLNLLSFLFLVLAGLPERVQKQKGRSIYVSCLASPGSLSMGVGVRVCVCVSLPRQCGHTEGVLTVREKSS